jgi:hypothetical protein
LPALVYLPATMQPAGGILLVIAIALLGGAESATARKPPLGDPVLIRTGILCRWERRCMQKQQSAMAAALRYVERKSPPPARIQACNRNASRGSDRMDWIGFNNCIRNPRVRR